jgi:hypothetical protein
MGLQGGQGGGEDLRFGLAAGFRYAVPEGFMRDEYSVGWYGRAKEAGHRAASTRHVHAVKDGKPVCGYEPHPTMRFQFCAGRLHLSYVSCPGCLRKVAS